MSFLGVLGGGHLYRLGCAGTLNAAKVLAASPGQMSLSPSLLTSNGRVFTAKYYHSLIQKKKDLSQSCQTLVPYTSLQKGSVVPSRPMSSGDHVTLWTAERILSGALVPLVPLAILTPCAPFDYMLAFILTLHSHWGIEAIVVDYVRPSVFGEAIPKLAVGLVYGLSAMTLGGLFYFIYSDVGIGQAIRMLWKL